MSTGLLIALLVAVVLVATSVGALVYLSAGSGFRMGGVTLTGHVLAGANGMVPVANAVVHIVGGPGSGSTADVTTDAGGSYTYLAQAGATYMLWASLGTQWGSAISPTVTSTMPMAGSTATVDLIVSASDITGTVTDSARGFPIVGATISLADPSGSWWCCGASDANGRYLLWAITPGMYTLTVTATGYTATTALAYVSSMGTTVVQDVVLGSGAAGGVVLTGQVLAGANGTVQVAHSVVHVVVGTGGGPTTDITTDTAGIYRFYAQTSTTYTIWATLGISWGLATGPSVTQTTPAAPTTVVLNLTVPASDIRGAVTNRTTGLPIPGASMSIADPSGSWWCCQSTDSNGSYLLWTITAGTYTLTAAASGYNSTTLTVNVTSTATTAILDFSLS